MWQVVLPNSDHALDILSLLPFLQCKAELHRQEAGSIFLPWNLGSLILGSLESLGSPEPTSEESDYAEAAWS